MRGIRSQVEVISHPGMSSIGLGSVKLFVVSGDCAIGNWVFVSFIYWWVCMYTVLRLSRYLGVVLAMHDARDLNI